MTISLLTRMQISDEVLLPRRAISNDQPVRLSDPALRIMTDFTREYPVTVDEEQSIDAALAEMIRLGVRAMLVMRGQRVVGFISSYDIQGERPLQYLLRSNHALHDEVQVSHIMTPLPQLVALNWQAVKNADVGEILDAFRHVDAMHLLVMETGTDSTRYVRGVFSKTRIERQLIKLSAVSA